MRVFWVLVLALLAAGLAYPALQSARARKSAAEMAARAEADRAAAEEARAKAGSTRPAQPDKPSEVPKAAALEAKPETPPASKPEVKPEAVPATGPATVPAQHEPAKPEAPAPEIKIEIPKAPEPAPKPEVPHPTLAQPPEKQEPIKVTVPQQAPPVTPPAPQPSGATPAPEAPAGPKIVQKDDGSMLVDDRFVVKGKGTAEAPYEITWEMLVSANETYEPRLGRKKLPERITMLDGKFVRLTGYVAYPMFVEQPRELLSMLNQWDGCCIGVPPTPYDAVEVHLKEPATKEQRLAVQGAVEGKFQVKPYLAGDWLVGLYVMEGATLSAKQYGGFGS